MRARIRQARGEGEGCDGEEPRIALVDLGKTSRELRAEPRAGDCDSDAGERGAREQGVQGAAPEAKHLFALSFDEISLLLGLFSSPSRNDHHLLEPANAVAEPRHAARRARRRPGARARLRESRLSPRRGRSDPAPLRRPALDLVPPRVQGLATLEAAAAREVHRAVLPRRGHGACRGAPPVRSLPARGLQQVRRAVDCAPSRPTSAPTRSTPGCTRSASTSTRGSGASTASRWTTSRTARSSSRRVRRTSSSASRLLRWTPGGYADAPRRPRGRGRDADHAAVACCAAGRVAVGGAAAAPVGREQPR